MKNVNSFGDGIFGNRLENGNVVTATYVITNGAEVTVLLISLLREDWLITMIGLSTTGVSTQFQ